MARIYYESDFKINEKFAREELVSVPFKYTYYTTRKYEASWDGKDGYKNCKREKDGNITVIFNSHGLGIGKLKVRREYFIPDIDFADGVRNEIDMEDTDILLVNREGDDVMVDTEVIPPYIYIQEIVDNTEDASPNKALSANQGKVLNERINNVNDSLEQYVSASCVVDLGEVSTSGVAEERAAQLAGDKSVILIRYKTSGGQLGTIRQVFSNTSATIQYLYLSGSRYVREVSWAIGQVGSWKNVTGCERFSGLEYNKSTRELSIKDALGASNWGKVTLSFPDSEEQKIYEEPKQFFGSSLKGSFFIYLENVNTRSDFLTNDNKRYSLQGAYDAGVHIQESIYEYLKNKQIDTIRTC
jgi:hypothetical protein